jgi:predicted dinucleotide-binding enzyme
MTLQIGIVGSGEMGRTLAVKLLQLGHKVAMANSRGPVSLQTLAAEIGIMPVSVAEAVKCKIIILSIPQKNIPDLRDVFKGIHPGTIVIDTGNYYPTLRDGAIAALDQTGIDSLWVQDTLGFPVVKAFNAILATSLRDLGTSTKAGHRVAIPVSADDEKAKRMVSDLINTLGFNAFDVGTISQSWKQQPGSRMYCRDLTRDEMAKRASAMASGSAEHEAVLRKRKADETLMAADYPAYLKSLRD